MLSSTKIRSTNFGLNSIRKKNFLEVFLKFKFNQNTFHKILFRFNFSLNFFVKVKFIKIPLFKSILKKKSCFLKLNLIKMRSTKFCMIVSKVKFYQITFHKFLNKVTFERILLKNEIKLKKFYLEISINLKFYQNTFYNTDEH